MSRPTVDVLAEHVARINVGRNMELEDYLFNDYRRDHEDNEPFSNDDADHIDGMRCARMHVERNPYPTMAELIEMLRSVGLWYYLHDDYTAQMHELAGQCYKAFLTERVEDVIEIGRRMNSGSVRVLAMSIRHCRRCTHVSGRHIHNKMFSVLNVFDI